MIPLFKVYMSPDVMKPLEKTLMSGWIGQGKKVDEFETELGKIFGNPNVLTVNSGTSALHLAYRLCRMDVVNDKHVDNILREDLHGAKKFIITTPQTCTATTEPFLELGFEALWADIDKTTGNILPESIEEKIENEGDYGWYVGAISIVDWGGYPCDIDEIKKIAHKHQVPIIQDAAHSFMAEYKGQPVGSLVDYTCFSFQAIKHMTTGDGGALVCKDKESYELGKLLRWYGLDRTKGESFRCSQDIQHYGYKFHMNDINATIGLENLKEAKEIVEKHRANAVFYNEAFAGAKNIDLPQYKADRKSSYWLYTLLVNNPNQFIKKMGEKGIMCSQVHARNDKHPIFASSKASLPGVDYFTAHQVAIPVGWWLTEEDREYIAKTTKEVVASA